MNSEIISTNGIYSFYLFEVFFIEAEHIREIMRMNEPIVNCANEYTVENT